MSVRTVTPFTRARALVQDWTDVRWPLLGLWVGLFLVRGLFYLALLPPWQAPDEPTSVELLLTMAAHGRTVSSADMDPTIQRTIIDSMERGNYWAFGLGNRPMQYGALFKDIWPGRTQLNRPPLYHLLLMPAAQLTSDWSIEARLYVFRGLSLLLVSLTVLIVCVIAASFARELPALLWALPALAALHPQLTGIGVSVNSDNLAGLIGALVFWLLLCVCRDGLSWRRGLLLAVLLLLGFWTKRTTLFLLPTTLFALLLVLRDRWRQFEPEQRRRGWQIVAGVSVALALLLALPPVAALLNRYLFDGVAGARLSYLLDYLQGATQTRRSGFVRSALFLNRTFWADFGWHRGVLPAPLSLALLGVLLGGWLSVLLAGRTRLRLQRWQRQFLLVCWAGGGLCLLQTYAHYHSFASFESPHGRYLFPALVPLLLLLAIGLVGRAPARARWPGLLVLGVALVFDLYAIYGVLIPAFYS